MFGNYICYNKESCFLTDCILIVAQTEYYWEYLLPPFLNCKDMYDPMWFLCTIIHADVHTPFSSSFSFLSKIKSVWQGTTTGLVTQTATKWKLAGLFLNHIHQKTKTLILRATLALSKKMTSLTQQHTADWQYTLPVCCTFITTFNPTANLRA